MPLLLSFHNRFPILEGCCRGVSCTLCGNTGVKCAPKGIVYSATCTKCEAEVSIKGNNHVYVGETSRPWRERVREHLNNASNWMPKSFILDHWMWSHSTDTEQPEFKFKILSSYSDALRRQLSEGVHILDKGGLNRKNEFCQNMLCRMEVSRTINEKEEFSKELTWERKTFTEKMSNFIDVMKNIKKIPNTTGPNLTCNFRSKKRRFVAEMVGGNVGKRLRGVDTSTPQHSNWRQDTSADNSLEESPIGQLMCQGDQRNNSVSYEENEGLPRHSYRMS